MQIKFILLACMFLALSCHGFSQEIKWQSTFGGADAEAAFNTYQTTDGGYICAGFSESNISGNKTENSYGGQDMWIVRLSSSGSLIWQNTIGGSLDDRAYVAIETPDGGFLIGGYSDSDSSGEKTENSKGEIDIWLVKLDANGVPVWQKTIGGDLDDCLFDMKSTSDGGYVCLAYSASMISGDKTENSFGGGDYWILKIDTAGNILWQKTIGGNAYEEPTSIIIMPDGGFVVGGISNSPVSGNKTEICLGSNDYYIVRLDTLGNIIWQKAIGGLDMDMLRGLTLTPDGGIICGGDSQSDSSQYKSENNLSITYQYHDFWIVKLDSSGAIVWENTIGGNGSEYLKDIKCFANGDIVCGGYAGTQISHDITENTNGGSDFWIVKMSPDGKIKYQNSIGGLSSDVLHSLNFTFDGNIICGGSSASNISGDKITDCYGSIDYWILELFDQHNFIGGSVFMDFNQNSIFDSLDVKIKGNSIIETFTGNLAFTDSDGDYYISVSDTGTFEVSPTLFNGYFAPTPASYSVNFNGLQQTNNGNDFALQATNLFNDLCLTLTPLGAFRSGFDATYRIDYSNVGTTVMNPVIVFYLDSHTSFISSIPTPDITTPDSIIWYPSSITPFSNNYITIKVNINPGLPLNTLINSGAAILPIIGDVNPSCNQMFWEMFTTGSYDPNDILVNRSILYPSEVSSGFQLDYLIRFQNTGNDTAFTVKLLNPIDTNFLDLNSLQFVNSSHPVDIKWINWECNLEFMFENILLVDSNANESLSHGFVRYRIQPKQILTVGDSILNSVAIYFDFNPPVITNTAITEIALPTSLSELGLYEINSLIVHPNPASEVIKFPFSDIPINNIIDEIVICDAVGQTIINLKQFNASHKLNISQLSEGLYFVRIRIGDVYKAGKFLKW